MSLVEGKSFAQNAASFKQIRIKNISNNNTSLLKTQKIEKLYVKFTYKSNPYVWHDCRFPERDLRKLLSFDRHQFHDHIIRPSLFHGLWDGCLTYISVDDTIDDIILHDLSNTTYLSLKENFNGLLMGTYYMENLEICAKLIDGIIVAGLCDCQKCVALFDEQLDYAFEKRSYCSYKDQRGPWCKCFDISGVTMKSETALIYHDHKVCTECKYDSHC